MFTIGVPQMRLSGTPSIMVDVGRFSRLPSSSTISFSLCIALLFLLMARVGMAVLSSVWRPSAVKDEEKKAVAQQQQQQEVTSSEVAHSQGHLRKSWNAIWRWRKAHAALPISLTIGDEMAGVPVGKGAGVGLGAGASFSHSETSVQQLNWQHRRSGPAFESPLPAIYQSEVPVSMAKIIMSRHTIRRPSQRPPPKRAVSPNRQQHIV